MDFDTRDLYLLLQTLAGIAGVCLFLRWYEPRMIYYPHIPTRQVARTPAEVGLAFDAVPLVTLDNETIRGWYIPAPDTTVNPFVLLYFHGNAGNLSHCLEKLQVLHDLGFALFAIDYRGYGESTGRPSEKGMYQDADAAYDYLATERGLALEDILLYGESLGSGVAVDLAARVPVGGIILEAAYTSLADVGQRIFWFLPVHWLVRNRYESRKKLGKITTPLLLLHSRDDTVFRFRHAERLLATAQGPKRLVPLRGMHSEAFFTSRDECCQALREFGMERTSNATGAR